MIPACNDTIVEVNFKIVKCIVYFTIIITTNLYIYIYILKYILHVHFLNQFRIYTSVSNIEKRILNFTSYFVIITNEGHIQYRANLQLTYYKSAHDIFYILNIASAIY